MTTIGIYIFDGAEELDWAGPWEVLAAWRDGWPDDGAAVVTISRSPGTVTCAKGLRVLADHTWDDCPPLDVLVYPGGIGTRPQIEDPDHHTWLRGLADAGALLTSVCTGSLVFAGAGLLDGRPATTHWSQLDTLGRLGTGLEVRPEARFVDTGEVVTAAGVSAGIDMALHLVARLRDRERAAEVRRYIQYDPEPPV